MDRLLWRGAVLLLVVLLSGKVLAQVDTIKFNKYLAKKCWTDTKKIATAPFRWNGKEWSRVGMFVAGEGILSLADLPVRDFAQSVQNQPSTYISKHFLEGFGAEHSFIVISGILTYGLIARDRKYTSTAMLAVESFGLATLVTRVAKTLAGRQRPDEWHNDGPYSFRGPFKGNSFPSGHTTASFAVASVIATQFRDSKWIPITAYSVAGLAGLSRIYDNKHWLTDVVAGATIGTLIGNMVAHRTPNEHLSIVPFGGAGFQGIKIAYTLN